MELEPQTETGKCLVTILANWIRKSPEFAIDKLKRLFLTNSLKVKNGDGFVAALYGQNILDETPSVLSLRLPSTLLRVQYGMEICLNQRRAKELVAALELSENQGLLSEVVTWTEENSKKIQESINRASSVDLAPEKAQKRMTLSKIIPGVAVVPRYREIRWKAEEKYNYCTTVEVCNDKIIAGYKGGQIKIYNSASLSCETVINYGNTEAHVSCLQCTCTKVISGYGDGSICVWNIPGGSLAQKLSLVHGSDESNIATCMRWRDPKLVVGTDKGRINIWESVGSSFTPQASWYARSGEREIQDVGYDLYHNYVIVQAKVYAEPIRVHDCNGQQVRALYTNGDIIQIALYGNRVITCNTDGTLQIWNIRTGDCLKELKRHGIAIFGVDPHDGVVATGTRSGVYTIWNLKATLDGSRTDFVTFLHAHNRSVPFSRAAVKQVKLGTNVLAAMPEDSQRERKILVTDFFVVEQKAREENA